MKTKDFHVDDSDLKWTTWAFGPHADLDWWRESDMLETQTRFLSGAELVSKGQRPEAYAACRRISWFTDSSSS